MSLGATEEFAQSTEDDFEFPDIGTGGVESVGAGESNEETLEPDLEESVSGLKETLSGIDDLDSLTDLGDISADTPSVKESEMFEEDAHPLDGDDSLEETGERKNSGTVQLDPSEIEEILQSEVLPEEEGDESAGRKRTALVDDDELAKILDEEDETEKPNS